jgi:hypothetical protein
VNGALGTIRVRVTESAVAVSSERAAYLRNGRRRGLVQMQRGPEDFIDCVTGFAI